MVTSPRPASIPRLGLCQGLHPGDLLDDQECRADLPPGAGGPAGRPAGGGPGRRRAAPRTAAGAMPPRRRSTAEARLAEKGLTIGTIPPDVMAGLRQIGATMTEEWVAARRRGRQEAGRGAARRLNRRLGSERQPPAMLPASRAYGARPPNHGLPGPLRRRKSAAHGAGKEYRPRPVAAGVVDKGASIMTFICRSGSAAASRRVPGAWSRLAGMRRFLDALYSAGAGLAALSLFGIFSVMMAQVVMRAIAGATSRHR